MSSTTPPGAGHVTVPELWRTPASALWGESDHSAVARLCTLLDVLVEKPDSPGLHSAAARLEDGLGLTPRGRAALGVEIDEPERPAPVSRVPALGDTVELG